MGYLDSLIDFKTTTDGEIIYYPQSIWGKGFIVPSLEKKKEIQKAVKRIYKIFLPVVMVGSTGIGVSVISAPGIGGWIFRIFTLLLLVAVTIWGQRSLKKLTQGLVESHIKITLLESFTNSALSMNFVLLLFLIVASWLAVFTGFQIARSPQYFPWFYRPVGIIAIIFFGFGGVAFTYMIVVKIKKIFGK